MSKKPTVNVDNSVIVNMLALIKEIANTHNVTENEVATLLSECIVKAYTKENQDQQLTVNVDLQKQEIDMKIPYEVVSMEMANNYDDYNQVLENDERVQKENLKVGDKLWVPIAINDLSRKVITTIIQGFKQKINEIDYTKIANEYKDRIGTIILGEVEEYNSRNGEYIIKIAENVLGGLNKNEQNVNEKLVLGSRIAFYLENVKAQTRDWPLILSRKSKVLTEYYLNLVTPEIRDGDIQVREIARIAGFKSKIAVSSTKFAANIGSPAAICVGKEGARVKEISRHLGGEPVEIVNWYANPLEFVINTIGANKIIGVNLDEITTNNKIVLVVKDEFQTLIIGKRGMNIRLCSELTHFNLDIKTPEDMRDLEKTYIKTKDVLADVESYYPTPTELKNNVIDVNNLNQTINDENLQASDFGLEIDFMDKVCNDESNFVDSIEFIDQESDNLFDNNEYAESLMNDFKDDIENVKKTK